MSSQSHKAIGELLKSHGHTLTNQRPPRCPETSEVTPLNIIFSSWLVLDDTPGLSSWQLNLSAGT